MSEKRKKQWVILSALLLLCMVLPAKAAYKPLNDSAQVSILISDPCNEGFSSLFGHTALRVDDPKLEIDYVFNYGIAGFESNFENFFRLLQGNHPCDLYAIDFWEIEKEHIHAKRQMVELVLNFSQEEKELLWQTLLTKSRSSDTIYYDVLKRNCTSLPALLIEGSVHGKLLYSEQEIHESYQSLCDRYLQNYSWSKLLLDISFGIQTNTPITYKEAFFIPDILKEAFLSAQIQDKDGSVRPLVSGTLIIVPKTESDAPQHYVTPFTCGWILLFLVLLLTFAEWRKKIYLRWVDAVLFVIVGLSGIYLFYVNFIAAAWYAFPSWWLLCIHPLHLLGAVFCASKRFDKAAYYYHIFNLCALGIMVIGTCFIPQHYNPAFVLLLLCLVIRSMKRIYSLNIYFILFKNNLKNFKL